MPTLDEEKAKAFEDSFKNATGFGSNDKADDGKESMMEKMSKAAKQLLGKKLSASETLGMKK